MDVVESQFGDGTVATTLTTTLVSVSDARDHLLGGEGLELTGGLGGEGFDGGSSSESPTRTTVTLILNGGNDVFSSPINGGGDVSSGGIGGLQSSEHVLGLTVLETLGETHGGFLEFVLGLIGEVIDTLLVAHFGIGIVRLDLRQLLFEDSLSLVVFSREFGVTLVEVLDVVVEGIV